MIFWSIGGHAHFYFAARQKCGYLIIICHSQMKSVRSYMAARRIRAIDTKILILDIYLYSQHILIEVLLYHHAYLIFLLKSVFLIHFYKHNTDIIVVFKLAVLSKCLENGRKSRLINSTILYCCMYCYYREIDNQAWCGIYKWMQINYHSSIT